MSRLILSSDHAGLQETLGLLQQRRRLILQGAFAGAAVLASGGARAVCALIPSETAGPYPGDGTNGPNALSQSGILRTDIRSSFGSFGTATAAGVRLDLRLRLVSTLSGCAPLSGLAVYAWHCNATGGYSLYSAGVTSQNYLRGVQLSDQNGVVSFISIFPGCYPGRWPHIHFEVFADALSATAGSNALRISQLALPEASCRAVFANTALYGSSNSNLNGVTLSTDNVFRDDMAQFQLATVTQTSDGYLAELEIGIAREAVDPGVFADGFE